MLRYAITGLWMVFFAATGVSAQGLTISSGGQTGSSGTNWSISGNTLTVTGTANIAASVITGQLASNSLSIQGNSTSFAVYVNQAISSSASGNGLTIGAASNTGSISLNSAVSLAGAVTIIGGRVSISDAFSLTGSNNLSITSINTVVISTVTVGGIATINASGSFILGTNITAGTGFPLTATGGFTKTGAGTSYLFSNINTTNTAVTIAGPVVVGNFNTSSAITQINSNGGNISIPGAVSAYSGTGREYMALVYANFYDATGGAVTGSTTDIYLRFNAGNQTFVGLPGMPASFSVQYVLVAGGGGGGGSNVGVNTGGGGGGGGAAEGNLTYNAGNTLSMVIGAGGVGGGGNCCINGLNGGDTGFDGLGLWAGGGGGGGNSGQSAGNTGTGNNNLAVAGRSYLAGGGGGGSGRNNFVYPSGGTGTLYSQAGSGTQTSFGNWGPWGGGGGGAVSGGYFFGDLAYGGAGRSSSITGTSVVYGSGSGPRDRTSTIGSGGSSNTSDAATVNGSNGGVILRFALSSSLDAVSLSTSFHLNAVAGSVTLGSTVANLSAMEITADAASSITGPVTGSGSLLKTGTGALTLSGDNRYTGGTTVTTGTLVLNDTSPMDGMGVVVGTLNINQNGTVQLTGLAAALGYNANRVTTININGGILETSSGQQHIWNLTGGLNFNGGGILRSNAGTSDAAATSYFEWGATNITITNPTAPAEIAGRVNLRSDLGGITFTVADGTAENDLLISAAITQTSAPALTKTGAGKLTFTGINSYTGTTTISAGTLQIGSGGTLGTISSAGVTNNAALVFNRSDAYTISNVISGTGTVTKTGAGTLTLSGANTYTGLTTISQGILKCGSTSPLGTVAGGTTITDGAALDLNGNTLATAEPLTINGTGVSASGAIYNSTVTAVTFPGPITLASNATINGTAGDLTLSGTINGAFALNISSTNKTVTQSGILGGTTPPTAYTVNVGATGQATFSGATTVAGPVSITGGTLAVNANLTATSNTVTLTAGTTVTQTAPITANGLDLNGAGTFTLTNTSNNIVTLAGGRAASKTGTVNYMDSDGFTIGTVTNTGITTSGTVTAETQLGNITIAQNITTDNATTSAVTINAAKPKSIGDATGGNIIISGTPVITTGVNGIVKLFSGRVAESTGLSAFVGGTSYVRLGVDENTVTFSPVLSNGNKYALYRYDSTLIGGLTVVASGGAAVNNGWEFANNTIQPTSATAVSIDTSVVNAYLNANPLTIRAGSVTFNSNLSGRTANSLSVLSNTYIKNTAATSITTQGGNVLLASNVDDATDSDATTNGYIQFSSGLTMTTNGGNITLGGGDATASGYAYGTSAYPYEGIRVDGTLNLNSGGGNIVMRGKSYTINSTSARWALGFWVLTTGSINSGTGTILLDGFSQSSGSSYSSALYNNGALTITSANTTADAIRMIGKATGTSGDAWGIEANSALSVLATGDGGGITISTSQQLADNYDAVFRGETNILAKSGPIQLLGKQDGGVANGRWYVATNFYLGSKAASAVTTSSSDITIQYDKYNFTVYPFVATSGSVNWKSASASFGQEVFTSWFNWNQNSQTMSGLTIGKSGNAVNLTHQTNAITVAGPISFYGGIVALNQNLTSSATGDVFLKGITGGNQDVYLSSGYTISKTAGTGTLTLQGNGGTSIAGSVSATGSAKLNTVLWSDYDNTNEAGVRIGGTISTNGGEVWLGGSSSNGGSSTWKGLTVGDGPSIGSSPNNSNAIDFNGNITTGGGELFVWAGDGNNAANGIITDADGCTINTGTGNVTFIADRVFGSSSPVILISTGLFTFVPHGGSWPSAFSWAQDALVSGNINLQSHLDFLTINNYATLGGLNFGYYTGMSGITFNNTSDILFTAAASVAGPISVYGGSISLNANLSTTNATTGNIALNGTTIAGTGNMALAAGRTATINMSSASTYDGLISGTGSGFTKSGAGLLTLTKDHTYSGPTVVSAGDLQVGTGGSVSQASSGTVSSTSGVTVASNSKFILTPNENVLFAAPISGAGGVEIKGASGAYYNAAFLSATWVDIAASGTVLEILTRITGGQQCGTTYASSATLAAGAYRKSYDAATNTATLQFQQYDGTNTLVVFARLQQSGAKVQISVNTTPYGTGAAFKAGNNLGTDLTTGGTSRTLATSCTVNQIGIKEVYMSGKVNFTGALTYTGTTTLSNTVTSSTYTVAGTNTYSYTSKGTQEITDASSSFPTGGVVVNNGLVIFNRATALTISNDMSGTEDVLQVGADITFTGANTYTGSTTLDLNKKLNIGSGGTTGSITGNIINYGTLTLNRSDSSSYAGIISGSGALVKSASNVYTLTGLNTYTGSSTINGGTLIVERDVPATSSSSYSGVGTLVIQPGSNSFTSAVSYPIAGFTVSSSIGGLTIGKPANTANITFTSATQAAGRITAYGGTLTINDNVSSSGSGDIGLYGNTLTFGSGKTVTSGGRLIVAPQASANTIGIGGAAGTLQLPASYFTTNFTDGFSNIVIGSDNQSGNIALNTFTIRDNMTFKSSGTLTPGFKPVLNGNNITLGTGLTVSASSSNFFQTNSTGVVNSAVAPAGTVTFHAGNSSLDYVRVTNNNAAADTFSVRVQDVVYANSVNRNWYINKTATNSGSGVNLEFNWNSGDVSGTLSSAVLNEYNGTQWVKSSGTQSVSGNQLTITGYTGTLSNKMFMIGSALEAQITVAASACQNATGVNVTCTGLNGTAPYTFTYTINGGSNQTVTTTSGNSVTVAVNTASAGSLLYSLVNVEDAIMQNTATGTATIVIKAASATTVTASSCTSYLWNGTTYTTSGAKTWTGTNAAGCDSVVTLNLTIKNATSSSETVSACGSYLWNGSTYTTSGTNTWTGTNAAGCDSVVTLNLTIKNATSSSETASACGSYLWNGTTYTTSGAKIWTGANAAGCDSVVTLNLTIKNATSSSETASACVSYLWHGTTYPTSGAKIWTGTNAAGCDSVVTLNLTIKNVTSSSETASYCVSYLWHGTTYTTSGAKTWTGTNAAGCDSVVTLNLTILAGNNPTDGGTIAASQSGTYPFDPAAFTSSAAASGHSGTLEYKWQLSTTGSTGPFSDISSSDAATYDAGALTATTWFRRLARVSCSGDWTGAAESNVLEATVIGLASEPEAQATSLFFTNSGTSAPYDINLNFTASASASGYLVVRKTLSAPTFVPVDGTTYTAGAQGGDTIVYVGSATSMADIAVTTFIDYHYRIYAFNGSGAAINYATSNPLRGKTIVKTTNSEAVANTSHSVSAGFPTEGVNVTFYNGTTGSTISATKTNSAPPSNFSALPGVRGVVDQYFSISSSNASAGSYTLTLDFSGLNLTPTTRWNSFKILKRADATAPWLDITTIGGSILNRHTDGVWGKFTLTGLSSFSEFTGGTEAVTIVVTTTDETGTGSLKQAILDATAGDFINFDTTAMGSKTIALTTPLVINKDLTIQGANGGITLNGNGVTRVMDIRDAVVVRLDRLKIENGSGSDSLAGGIWNNGNLTMVNCVVSGNAETGDYGAGGILQYSGGTDNQADVLNLVNCTVSGNSGFTSVGDKGIGGLSVRNGTSNIYNTIIYGNTGDGSSDVDVTSSLTLVDHSDIGNLSALTIATSTANISTDPGFVGAANATHPFAITGSSPAADAGSNSACLETTDIRGGSFGRKLNKADGTTGTNDMGAYEFGMNTWTGTTNNNFNTATNWSLGTVPAATDIFTITTGTPQLNVDYAVGGTMTLSGTGTLTINAGKTLSVGALGTAALGGMSVTIKSDATGTGAIGQIAGTLTGATNVTVERYIGTAKRAWRLLSIPITGTTIRDAWAGVAANGNAPTGEVAGSGTIITGHSYATGASAAAAGFDWFTGLGAATSSSIRYYADASWNSATNTPNILASPGKQGYMLYVRGDRTIANSSNYGSTTLKPTGSLITGTQSVTISNTNLYEVVGNPYASSIDLNAVYLNAGNSNVILRKFWVWDATLGTSGAYRAMIYDGISSYVMTGGDGDVADYLKLQSGQAFFVEKNGTGGSLSITESNKASASSAVVMGAEPQNSPAKLSVSLYQAAGSTLGAQMDGILARFGADYQISDNHGKDVVKFNNFNENISLQRGNRYLSIESRPFPAVTDTLFVPFWNLPNRAYALKISAGGFAGQLQGAKLRDAFTKTETPLNLSNGSSIYPFSVTSDAASSSLSRFTIVLTAPQSLPVTFTKVDATPRPTGIDVSWKTGTEVNVKDYSVERSSDGISFTAINSKAALNATNGSTYNYLDLQPLTGRNYYRIRSNDQNGSARLSSTVAVQWDGKPGLGVFPTAITENRFRVQLSNQPAGIFTLSLTTVMGEQIMTRKLSHLTGSSHYDVALPNVLVKKGWYQLRIITPDGDQQSFRLFITP